MVPRPGGDSGPTRAQCAAALAERMPELVPMHRQLARLRRRRGAVPLEVVPATLASYIFPDRRQRQNVG